MPSQFVDSSDQVTVALHDLGGDGPPLLLCHATGFHGMVWKPVADELAEVAHCWALDFRGHGDSGPPASGDMGWSGMATDVLAVVDHLGLSEVRAAGHSMGGAALFLAEQARPGTFAALWCYEPIVFPRAEGAPRPQSNPMSGAARRRRRTFESSDAALATYAAKPPLDVLDPEVLEAYVRHGFRPGTDGDGVELKCDPEVEAAVFEGAIRANAFDRLGEVASQTTIAFGGDGHPPARIAPLVADALPHARLKPFPQLTHFGPMEDPRTAAAAIRKAVGL